MDFVGSSSGGISSGSVVGAGFGSSDNGPILYSEPNRTSAIDDIRSVVIYIFIITIFFSFFLILPGIRNEKFPTFLCITTSLIVTSIILISLFGTTWHVGEAPISAAYKAFSRDRIQGELSVKIGLQSVNITLRAHKYYILDATNGPMIMENAPVTGGGSSGAASSSSSSKSFKRVDMDINYNERFYWIGPNQMRQEHHHALERGLPYPILTVVEYLSQDDAGFSWSRQYRLAGYYSYICLWLSLCVCVLMFVLHCAAPKYGIYAMQTLGCLLLFTNFTYATLVPRGEQKLVIPFEGQSLSFKFGWNFWMVLIGGCLSLTVGTIIVLIDKLLPNFIFTTVLDVDFDSHHSYYRRNQTKSIEHRHSSNTALERPIRPPFYSDDDAMKSSSSNASASNSSQSSPSFKHGGNKFSSSSPNQPTNDRDSEEPIMSERLRARHQLVGRQRAGKAPQDAYSNDRYSAPNESKLVSSKSSQLYSSSLQARQYSLRGSANASANNNNGVFSNHATSSDSENEYSRNEDRLPRVTSSVVEMATKVDSESNPDPSDTLRHAKHHNLSNHRRQPQQSHYSRGRANKNANLKSTDHQALPGARVATSLTNNEVNDVRL